MLIENTNNNAVNDFFHLIEVCVVYFFPDDWTIIFILDSKYFLDHQTIPLLNIFLNTSLDLP